MAFDDPHVYTHSSSSKESGRPSFIIPVTAGLGIVPAVWVPGYSASKSAIRSFTTSLRAQLKDTNVHVLEIIPPYVSAFNNTLAPPLIHSYRLVESELHDGQFMYHFNCPVPIS